VRESNVRPGRGGIAEGSGRRVELQRKARKGITEGSGHVVIIDDETYICIK